MTQTDELPLRKRAPKNPISKGRKGRREGRAHRTFHRALGVKLHRKKRSEEINSGKGVGRSTERQGCALLHACVCTYVRVRASDFQ